jgi:hypothetical protein
MAVAKVTSTGKIGPDKAVTSLVLEDVTAIVLDFKRQVTKICKGDISGPGLEVDMAQTITITDTVAGAGLGHTIVVSSS